MSKYGGGSDNRMLYTEEDLEKSMEKIEVMSVYLLMLRYLVAGDRLS